MTEIKIQNATYEIHHVFVGSRPVTELIQNRVCTLPQNFPLTNESSPAYNQGERTVVRRYNGQ